MKNGLGDVFYYDAEGQLTDSVHDAANRRRGEGVSARIATVLA